MIRTFHPLRLLALVSVALSVLCSQSQAEEEWQAKIRTLAESHRGKVSVAVKHPASGGSFTLNQDVPMPTASLIKFPVMVEAYRQADAGLIDLNKPVTLKQEDKVGGSGILTSHLSAGVQMPLRDYIRLMMSHSDNTATNVVVNAIGIPATAAYMEKLGYPETKIHSPTYRRDLSAFPERSVKYGLGSTTAADMVSLLERLYTGQLAGEASTREMLDHLRSNSDKDTFTRRLPEGTKVGFKGGAIEQVRTVAGFMELKDGPVFLCVMTAENKDNKWTYNNEGVLLIADISRIVYEQFGGTGPEPEPRR